ncbi:MAG: arylamine N-acetyltransferase [Deltaproteobacteria bacterium]|nr:arylamine N-acetyltransferase [Deltaproteobacteria bacterium]
MNENHFNIDAYFQRIKYGGGTSHTAHTLKSIHHAQLFKIPFENFDIQLGRAINLNPKAIFEKLIRKKRGGYCFELNGLFLTALRSIGFDARPLLARVHITGTPTGRGHQIELVTIDGKQWIADVGFGGDTPRTPIPLELNQSTIHNGQKVRLVEAGHFGIMLQTEKDDEWIDLYSFDLSHVFPGDIDYGNHFTSTHPSSLFVSARVAALPIKNGAKTLFNHTLKKATAGNENLMELKDGKAYLSALKTHFGIELDAPYEKLRPLPDDQKPWNASNQGMV